MTEEVYKTEAKINKILNGLGEDFNTTFAISVGEVFEFWITKGKNGNREYCGTILLRKFELESNKTIFDSCTAFYKDYLDLLEQSKSNYSYGSYQGYFNGYCDD